MSGGKVHTILILVSHGSDQLQPPTLLFQGIEIPAPIDERPTGFQNRHGHGRKKGIPASAGNQIPVIVP
jgi:hypothetical protein